MKQRKMTKSHHINMHKDTLHIAVSVYITITTSYSQYTEYLSWINTDCKNNPAIKLQIMQGEYLHCIHSECILRSVSYWWVTVSGRDVPVPSVVNPRIYEWFGKAWQFT